MYLHGPGLPVEPSLSPSREREREAASYRLAARLAAARKWERRAAAASRRARLARAAVGCPHHRSTAPRSTGRGTRASRPPPRLRPRRTGGSPSAPGPGTRSTWAQDRRHP